jgi:hypothetical protein
MAPASALAMRLSLITAEPNRYAIEIARRRARRR